jgi:hypothetical protein
MHQVDDLHRFGRDSIDEDVIGMHHGLARAGRPAGAIDVGMGWKRFGARFNGAEQPLGSRPVALRDVVEDRSGIVSGALAPEERQHLRRAPAFASMIARISTITSSCGTGGRESDSDAATFSFSHFS